MESDDLGLLIRVENSKLLESTGAVFLSALRSLSQSAENLRFLANGICTQRSYSPFSELSSTGGISDERRLLSLLRSRRFVLDR